MFRFFGMKLSYVTIIEFKKFFFGDFFQKTTHVLGNYSQVVNWANSKRDHYLQKAIDEFLDAKEADAWLVAYAIANKSIIVTQELSEPNRKSKIKIPDVCIHFNVKFVNTIEMFRKLSVSF